MPAQTPKSSILSPEEQREAPPAPNSSQTSVGTASFSSILFDDCDAGADIDSQQVPEFFKDLNLDQIVESITAGREEYNLKPFFYVPLKRLETINYRQDILRDLDNPKLFAYIHSFADEMRRLRGCRAEASKFYYKRQKQIWFLAAMEIYCGAAAGLARDIGLVDLNARGLLAFRDFLTSYTSSKDFGLFVAETRKLRADLNEIRYALHIEGKRLTVDTCGSGSDYSVEVLQLFEKFRQGEAKEYRFKHSSWLEPNHVEAAILDFVAQLYPEVFLFLDEYCSRHSNYLNSVLARFDREVQFYISYIEHKQRFQQAGLPFCFPSVTNQSKELHGRDTYDLGLANSLIGARMPVVTNSLFLKNPERIFVVSGPNQGGKTTFVRTFGQLHYLAALGFPVPGSEAQLFLFDKLFAHFEREEDIQNLSGKLEDELLRIHHILEQATPNSILVMNESFLSTTLEDSLFLSKQIMQRIIALDMICIAVTFLDEMAAMGETTVSMVSTVNPIDPVLRTFKIIRKPADGLAYAAAIAEKYHLTYKTVRTRIAVNAGDAAPL